MKTTPATKPFPWKCGHCRQRAVTPAAGPYTLDVEHDGRTYTLTVPDLVTPTCGHCGERVLDAAANERLSDALREHLGLLKPARVRAGREALGLTQEQLAGKLRVAAATVSRWETGAQIQQRAMDLLLRLYFGLAEVRSALADEQAARALGEAAA